MDTPTGIGVGVLKDDPQGRSTWLIVVASVAYLVVVGKVFNR